MHWIIQDNMFRERGVDELIGLLERHQIPHSLHKVVPFVGEIQPDIDVEGNVIVYGAYSLRHIAKKKDWIPGCFDLNDITYEDFIAHWKDNMLNSDIIYCTYEKVPLHVGEEEFFIRPVNDSKHFAGMVSIRDEFIEDWKRVCILEEQDGSTLTKSTPVMISSPKHILKEHRLWIVDGKIVTYSLYKQGAKVIYSHEIDEGVREFAELMIEIWQPLRAFVMDIATLDKDGKTVYKIIECNTFNAAGLYAADTFKIVEAIEAMEF